MRASVTDYIVLRCFSKSRSWVLLLFTCTMVNEARWVCLVHLIPNYIKLPEVGRRRNCIQGRIRSKLNSKNAVQKLVFPSAV
jgi:hypothetical protein